jgi:hypothetical protein
MVVQSNEDPKPGIEDVPAFLIFTKNFTIPEVYVKSFTGNDFV